MNEINSVLKRAAWRLGFANFLFGWVGAVAVLLLGAVVLRLAEQMFGFTKQAPSTKGLEPEAAAALLAASKDGLTSSRLWELVMYWGAAASVVAGIVWAFIVRPKKLAVACKVDEGANLRESLSTAVCIANERDPWSVATVQSASRIARGVNVAQAVPIQTPRFWPVVVALGLSLAVIFIAMPRMDVLGWTKKQLAAEKKKADVIQAVQQVEDVNKTIKEITSKIPSLEKEEKQETPKAETPEAKSPEEIKAKAIQNLTKISEQLEQLKSGEQAQKLEAMQQQLKNLREPGVENNELAKAMAKGDFKAAKEALEKMKQAGQTGEMSEADKEKLAAQMEQMAKKMEELAKNKEGMEKALEQAGIPKEAMKDPQSMKDAVNKSENLTESQKQALNEMMNAAMQSQEGMQQMAQAMQKMSEGMKAGDSQQASQAAEQLSQQMSEMEQIQQEMEAAEAGLGECQSKMAAMGKEGEGQSKGMGECKGGMGEGDGEGGNPGDKAGKWREGFSESMGNNRGGPGLGQGGRPGEAKADFDLEKSKNIGYKGDGPIVSSRMVEGESIKGESTAEFARVAAAAEQNATEAIEQNTIPREYHDVIKSYFGRLKGKSGPKSAAALAEKAKQEADEKNSDPDADTAEKKK